MNSITTMDNIKDFYILGLPIKTDIGNIRFLKVKDYPSYHGDLAVMKLTKDHIIQAYYDNGANDETLEALREASFYEVVMVNEGFRESYIRVFLHLCDDSIDIFTIGSDNFENIRSIILSMCVIKEEKINPNPEIQAWIDKSKNFKASQGGDLEFSDIVTSVAVGCGYTYDELNELTLFQLYNHFYRVAQFKNYDTSTLFATVASDKIDIDSWSKNIDVLKEERSGHTRSEFDKMTNNIF